MNKTAKKCYNVSKKYNIEYRHQWMHYMCSGFQKNHCNEWSQGFLSKSWMYSTSLLYFPIENRICLMNHSEIILSQNLIQSSEEIPYFNDEQFHLLKNAPFSKIVLPHFFYFNKSVRVSLINAIIYADKYKAHNDVSKKYYSGAP